MVERRTYLYLTLSVSAVFSFILLALTTFSAPMSTRLYFLRSSQARGVRFGIWGWCLEEDAICMSPIKLGYTWEPEISIPITGALVLYPIASILAFLLLLSLIPVFRARTEKLKADAVRVLRFFSVSSFIASTLAFVFMIAIFDIARKRFNEAGFPAQFGPLPWLSLLASFLLLAVTILASKTHPTTEDSQNPGTAKDEESRLTSPPHRKRLRPLSYSSVRAVRSY